jgi:RNA polymerase sigma-70 factor (ECF subfamily)
VADSDAALVARVIAGDDRSAFELLVRRHQSPLRNFLRRLTGHDAGRADDLAQETLIKMYRSIHTYKGTAKFSSWLYQIAYNTFLNDQRRRRPETEFDEAVHAAAVDNTTSAGDRGDVERALRMLPARQQAVFDLHYKKGMTHDEIATALGLPLGTVKSDLTRGRGQLKGLLEDWAPARGN